MKIIYIVIFLAVFVITTVAIAYFNSQFNNIFKFDFSPPVEVTAQNDQNHLTSNDSLKQSLDSDVMNLLDDTELSKNVTENKQLRDSLDLLRTEIEMIKNNESNLNNQQIKTVNQEDLKPENNEYKIWLKKTSALYASMDSKKAAKIIQNYSDNIARDILYTMKKKKAAEILAELNPEIVTRIMSVN
jgi:flagellar motility protein MotE (MotC chaperone)